MRALLISMAILLAFPVTASANEGAGLLSSDLEGALPKALWSAQPRSEIAYLLKNLPSDAPLRSLQQIKRDMLLSQYDIKTIKNDVEPSHQNNLLTLRLQKLIDMGLWEDAFRLYNSNIDNPQDNNPLAQIAVLLALLEKGLATACLEEKAFNNHFDAPDFWQQINGICNIEIGSTPLSTTDFGRSKLLRHIYEDETFKISANNIEALSTLSPLELALLSTKNRIDYKGIELKRKTLPYITKTFLKDSNFPNTEREKLNDIAIQQGILPFTSQQEESNLDDSSQEDVIRIIAQKLKGNQKISGKEYKKLSELAPNNPENYFYLSYIGMLQQGKTAEKISDEDISSSISALSIKTGKKVNFLKSLLDKWLEFSNNPANVYEKQLTTDFNGDSTVKESQIDLLQKTIKSDYAGLSLLIMLSNIENSAWVKSSVDITEEKTFNMLENLSKVGLIDQAHRVAKEELAILMMSYKN